jgi:hypothetical protein
LPLVARRIAPMRDLITGGWDVDGCGMANSPPFSKWPVRKGFSLADDCFLEGQSAMSARRDQPENTN